MVWENKTAPILGGREQTGIPKIYADIEDLHKIQQNYFTNASYEGNTFLRLEMTGAQPVDEPQLAEIKAHSAERALLWVALYSQGRRSGSGFEPAHTLSPEHRG